MKKSVMFVCTGNSARSQMAEGFARHFAGRDIDVYSAGTDPRGIHPLAVEVMGEEGIDISDQTSDLLDFEFARRMDYVITLCGDARDKCTILPPKVKTDHWPISDPAKIEGTYEDKLFAFREIRDQIQEKVSGLIEGIASHAADCK